MTIKSEETRDGNVAVDFSDTIIVKDWDTAVKLIEEIRKAIENNRVET